VTDRAPIVLTVNGKQHTANVEPSKLLLDVLREDLALTGTKRGCDDSSCGACTVLIDGVAMLSCTMLAACATDVAITTIEGLSEQGLVAAIQRGFAERGGAQCGYCTPGMILAAKAILDSNPNPSDEDIRAGLSGNICRCTGYVQIFESIKSAIAEELRARAQAS
jgi:carbon-monoxide dehydrogenase small subunit